MALLFTFLFYLATAMPSLSLSLATCDKDKCCYPDPIGCLELTGSFADFPLPSKDPSLVEPTFWRYRGSSNEAQLVITPNNFNAQRGLTIIVHGFNSDITSTPWHKAIVNKIFQYRNPEVAQGDVLFLDWRSAASLGGFSASSYLQAASDMRLVARLAGIFLSQNSDFRASNAHCIGFSLGSHLCGFIAKFLQQKWARMTVLDPAGPNFNKDDPRARCDSSDAEFVDAYHTSSMAGLARQVGHVDYYVNGGYSQPGCSVLFSRRGFFDWVESVVTDVIDSASSYMSCSHERAPWLFAESFQGPKTCQEALFCPCDAKTREFSSTTCDGQNGQIFGIYANPSRRGAFCGTTTAETPFFPNC